MDSVEEVDVDDALKLHDYITLLSPAQYLDYERFDFVMRLFCFMHCIWQLQTANIQETTI